MKVFIILKFLMLFQNENKCRSIGNSCGTEIVFLPALITTNTTAWAVNQTGIEPAPPQESSFHPFFIWEANP